MDHIIRISNKTCFSENKKAEQLGDETTFDYILCWLFWKKKSIGCGGGGELIFYIQENCSLLFIVFSSQSGQIGIFKRDWKNIYKKNIVYSNQTYCVKISWIVYRMKIEAVVFRIVWRNVLLLFTTLIQEYKMVLDFINYNKATLCIPKVFSS